MRWTRRGKLSQDLREAWMEEGVGNGEVAAYADSVLTCDRSGNCRNCAEWFTHQDRRGAPSTPPPRSLSRKHVYAYVLAAIAGAFARRRCRERERICAGFRKQLPTILTTWLAASDWRENPLRRLYNSAAERMRSSSLNRSPLNDWSNFFSCLSFSPAANGVRAARSSHQRDQRNVRFTSRFFHFCGRQRCSWKVLDRFLLTWRSSGKSASRNAREWKEIGRFSSLDSSD